MKLIKAFPLGRDASKMNLPQKINKKLQEGGLPLTENMKKHILGIKFLDQINPTTISSVPNSNKNSCYVPRQANDKSYLFNRTTMIHKKDVFK